jgi:hypothetical protein
MAMLVIGREKVDGEITGTLQINKKDFSPWVQGIDRHKIVVRFSLVTRTASSRLYLVLYTGIGTEGQYSQSAGNAT